jgi:hypothetical protein
MLDFGMDRGVCFERRSHNCVLREVGPDEIAVPIPWLGKLPAKFAFA